MYEPFEFCCCFFFFNVVFIFLPVQAAPLCERLFGGQIAGDVCKLVGYEHP